MASTRPILLQAFNAVPLTRTPWAGQDIYPLLGNDPQPDETRLGECWEFSCDPLYPSRLADTHTRLDTIIASDPRAFLSDAQVEQHGKLLPAVGEADQRRSSAVGATTPSSCARHSASRQVGVVASARCRTR